MKLRLWMKAGLLTVIAVAVFTVFRLTIGYEPLLDDVSAFAGFYSAFGVVFGIMAGFVLLTVWEQYNAVGAAIDVESRILRVISILLSSFQDNNASKQALENLREYAKAAVVEWKSLANHEEDPAAAKKFQQLLGIMRLFRDDNLGPRDLVLLNGLTDELRELSRARTVRISASKTQMPPTSWILLIFLSVALVATEYLLGVVNPVIAYAMIISIAGVTSLVVAIVYDLDNPFKGEWNVSSKAFEEIVADVS